MSQMSYVDWTAVRAEYEQGASLRSLAATYGVSKSLIGKKKFQEQWTVDSGQWTQKKSVSILPMPPDAVAIASNLLADLAHLTQGEAARLDYSEHVKASRALSEYVKVLIVAPREAETQERLSIPLDTISPRTRLAIQQLLVEDEQEKVG